MNQFEIIAPNDVALAEHAAVIRALGKRVVGDVIEIGRRLADCRDHTGHGGFLPWLKREFPDWSERTAYNFIQVHEAFGSIESAGQLALPVGRTIHSG